MLADFLESVLPPFWANLISCIVLLIIVALGFLLAVGGAAIIDDVICNSSRAVLMGCEDRP